MISQVNNGSVASTITNSVTKNRQTKENVGISQNNASKVERFKESINSGEYKVNLSVLASKMADKLL